MSSSADRKRLLRRRQREGKVVVAVEVDIDAVEALVDARLLSPMAEPDRTAIAHAIERLLRIVGRDASRRA